jgi:membrane fusion protein, heavy metal efflux system
MSENTFQVPRGFAIGGAIGFLLAGALGMRLWMQTSGALAPAVPPASTTVPAAEPRPSPTAGAVTLDLPPDALERAGIRLAPVGRSAPSAATALPAVVAADGYRTVVVTPLLSGRVTRVLAELGQRVRRGEVLATVQSPELAEAAARLRSARAALEAHDRERERTERLAGIGAASRQELERVHAEHAAQVAEVESARARLDVLGGRADAGAAASAAAPAVAEVRAPLDGTVTERAANAGLAVEATTPLFTVADLSRVWIVADVFEQDLARVRVGDRATVTVSAYPERRWEGSVSYLDPQVAPATRTARLRIELGNADRVLRPGMFAGVVLAAAPSASADTVTVPRSAVQIVGDRAVVYVAGPSRGRFVEREVRLGATAGRVAAIEAGLDTGESIVVDGSFFVRAEIERRGLRPVPPPVPSAGNEQTALVRVVPAGFEPDRLTVRAGVPLRLRFRRTTENTCATELAIPVLKVRRPLPLDEEIEVRFTPSAGEIAFACGMEMLTGAVVAQ